MLAHKFLTGHREAVAVVFPWCDVITGQVRELARDGDRLDAVVLADGSSYPVDAVAVQPRFVARGDLCEQLDGTQTENPMGWRITSDPGAATDFAGVWAAGNAGDLTAMVGASAAHGVVAGAAINADLSRRTRRRSLPRRPG